MKNHYLISLICILLLCQIPQVLGDSPEGYPITIIDSKERSITIDKPVERVVCTASQHLETMRSLGVSKDLIVGVPDIRGYSYFSDFQGKERIGHFYEPDVEKIVALKPDIVIVHPGPGPMGNSLDPYIANLEKAGIKVLLFYCNRPDKYEIEVKKLGQVFQKEAEADKFLEFYRSSLSAVQDKVKALPEDIRPRVYSEWDAYTSSDLDVYPIEMAGGKYIFAGQGRVREIDPETVVVAQPDIILRLAWDSDYDAKSPDDISKMKEMRDEILNRSELFNVSAVKTGRVYVMAAPFWVYLPYSSCRDFIGINYLAKWFHPEIFSDLNPEEIHQRYLTEFQGLDYDLKKRGIFVYPAEAA